MKGIMQLLSIRVTKQQHQNTLKIKVLVRPSHILLLLRPLTANKKVSKAMLRSAA